MTEITYESLKKRQGRWHVDDDFAAAYDADVKVIDIEVNLAPNDINGLELALRKKVFEEIFSDLDIECTSVDVRYFSDHINTHSFSIVDGEVNFNESYAAVKKYLNAVNSKEVKGLMKTVELGAFALANPKFLRINETDDPINPITLGYDKK